MKMRLTAKRRKLMKTIPEIIMEIITGISPRSEIGCIVSMIAVGMVYDWRL